MKNHFTLALIAVCGMSAGCQKLEETEKGDTAILFKVNTDGTRVDNDFKFSLIAVADDDWIDKDTKVKTEAGSYFEAMVKYDGSSWKTYNASGATQTDYMWLSNVGIHFWSYFPTSLGTSTGSAVRTITAPEPESDVLTFTYSQPAASAGSDATNQQDILFAGNKESRKFNAAGKITDVLTGSALTADKNDINIKFYHALSEIRFAVSTDDDTFDPSLTITNVAILNAAGSGSCEFTLPSTFEWSDLDNRCDYSQDYGTLPSETNSEWNVGSYTNSSSIEKNLYTNLNPFYLIPEDDLSSLSIEVTFKNGSGSTFTKTVTIPNTSWEAGKYYTYKIAAKLSTSLSMSLSLLDWDYIETKYDYTALPSTTPGVGELNMSNKSSEGSTTVVADTPIKATFTLDTPIGGTWLVSVTNTDAFEVYTLDGTGSENPAYGIIQNDSLGVPAQNTFYIKAKSGIKRSTVLSTKIHITVRLTDGTYVNVDDILGVDDWNIILNPLS